MIEFGMSVLIELPNLTECAKLCRDLGLRFLELNMNLPRGVYFTLPDEKVYLNQKYSEQYLENVLRFRDACDKAIGNHSVRICIENCEAYMDFQKNALDILLKSQTFGLTFDIGHNCTEGGYDESVIKNREYKLGHLHFHDANERQNHLALGEGEIEFPQYLRLAENNRYRVVLETKTVEGLKQSVSWPNRNCLSGNLKIQDVVSIEN